METDKLGKLLILEPKFSLKDIVYLVTDKEQLERIVIGYYVINNGGIKYDLMQGATSQYHWDFEITKEKKI